eukprot:6307933-Alexandrium_andersonii.AAC.1
MFVPGQAQQSSPRSCTLQQSYSNHDIPKWPVSTRGSHTIWFIVHRTCTTIVWVHCANHMCQACGITAGHTVVVATTEV